MVTILTLLFPVLAVCMGAPITEEELRFLIQPFLDANQSPINAPIQIPKATADATPMFASLSAASPQDASIQKPNHESPPLFAALAASSPLGALVIDTPQNAQPSQMEAQISPANQMAQLNLLNPLTNLVKNAIGTLRPQAGPVAPVDPLIGNMFPNGGVFQPAPAPVQPQRHMNMFNPLSFLFPGSGGGSPFGMMMSGLMMRMMAGLFELF